MSPADKRCGLDEAVGAVRADMHIGLGGVLDRLRPIALCHALARARADRLHVYSFLAGEETEILAAAGAIAVLTTGYIDPRAGATAIGTALQRGDIVLRETSEHVFVGGLLAAAGGLPFWPTLGATGSDVAAELHLRDVVCPYSGRAVLAVPATPLDVVLLHARAATASGAVLAPDHREFLDDADLTLARAAARVVVSVDRIAEPSEVAGGQRTVLAPFEVHAVVHLPPEGNP